MKKILQNHLLIRNLYAETLLENFLISAVATILSIRFYLQMTGYPSIGGEHFHIAHMLYGGMLMMVTIFMLFAFLNRTAFTLASIIGGIGFGFFIDELGKFITRDNNYFFQPTVALIYVIFILIYLAMEALPKIKHVSKKEYLINALELTKEVIVQELDANEKKQALSYLKASDQSDPTVHSVRKILTDFRTRPNTSDAYSRMKHMIVMLIDTITQNRQFYLVVMAIIILQSVISLVLTFLLIAALNRYVFFLLAVLVYFFSLYFLRNVRLRVKGFFSFGAVIILCGIYVASTENITIQLGFIGFATLLSTTLAALVAFIGILEFSKSHLDALKLFRLSILISLFLTQFFLFYRLQFLALIGLVVNVLMLLTIEYVISSKETDVEEKVLR